MFTNGVGDAEQFQKLSAADKVAYLRVSQHMVRFAHDHAVPIIFAPSLSIGGPVNGATGCILKMDSGAVLLTASHVVEGYEDAVERRND